MGQIIRDYDHAKNIATQMREMLLPNIDKSRPHKIPNLADVLRTHVFPACMRCLLKPAHQPSVQKDDVAHLYA